MVNSLFEPEALELKTNFELVQLEPPATFGISSNWMKIEIGVLAGTENVLVHLENEIMK